MRRWVGINPAVAGWLGVLLASFSLAGCGAFLTSQYLMARAQREMHAGEWQQAGFDLRAVLHKNARNADAWLLLARLALDTGNRSGAAAALAHSRAAGATGPKVDVLQARVWLASGQPQALLAALRHRTIDLPQPDKTVMWARALLASGLPKEAIARIQPLVAQQPGLSEAQDVLAESLLQQGNVGPALEILRTAERLDPKSPQPPLLAGRIDAGLGHFHAAERSLTQSLARMLPSEPIADRAAALVGLTEARLVLGKIDAAVQSQRSLAGLAPQAPVTRLLAARIDLARKHLIAGTDALEQLVVDAPKFVPARVALAQALMQGGEFEQAEQQLQQAITQIPDNLQARGLLGAVQLKLGQPKEALSVLMPALSAMNPDPRLLSLIGEAVRRAGNPGALSAALQRARHDHPPDHAVINNVAAIYIGIGQAQRALALLEKSPDDGDLRRDELLITALRAVRGPGAAGQQVDALVAAHPDDPRLLDLAASYAAARDQLQRSRSLLRHALSLDPHDVARQIALANVEESGGDVGAAQKRLRAALLAHPDVLALRLALAGALMRTRSIAQARAVLEAAPGAKSQPDVQFGLAQVALAENDLSGANFALDRAIAARPGGTGLVEDAGLLLMRANHYGAALKRFAQATAMEPSNALYWLDRARAELALSQLTPARSSLERAVGLQPRWLPAVSVLALLDIRQGKGQAALSRVNALIASQPRNVQALTLKGDLEFALHQPAAAQNAYSAAERVQPGAVLAVKLYQVRLAMRAADPIQPLNEWLKREPADWRVRSVLANYYLQVMHAPQRAVPELREVLRQQPDNVLALNNLAWALRGTGNSEARSLAERAYRLAPQSAAVNDTLGWILVKGRQGAQALGYLARAVKLAPGDPELAFHYAYVLAKTGRQAEARRILSKILASPQPFDARGRARRLLAALGI